MTARSVGHGGTWVIDLDGVVWLAGEPIAGVSQAIEELRGAGRRVLFASNNSSPTLAELQARLQRVGIHATDQEIVTSAQAAATIIDPGSRALLVAGAGAKEALEARGVETLSPTRGDPDGALLQVAKAPVDVVVVGWTADFDFALLQLAMRAVRAGARLVGTNDDPTYPTPQGLLPGAGSLLAAVAAAAQCVPEVAGKPHRPFARLVRGHAPLEVVVGDRPSTDGALARALHTPFALVTSGVTPPGAALPSPPPAYVEADLAHVVRRVLRGRSEYR